MRTPAKRMTVVLIRRVSSLGVVGCRYRGRGDNRIILGKGRSMDRTHAPEGRSLSRRAVLLGALGGLAVPLVGIGAGAANAAADYSAVPKLPLEVSRLDTQVSRFGQKYEAIDVNIDGDLTRLFVPHGVKVKPNTTKNAVVWYYHSTGSTYTALSSAFKWSAEMVLKEGAICVCPNFGGDQWVNDVAIARQKRASQYMSTVFTIGLAFLRANSGGAALMSYAYGKNLVPAARGMYSASGAINVEDLYAKDASRVGPMYNYDMAKMQATNPTRLPASAWKGKRMRFVMSAADPICAPSKHGELIIANTTGGAAEASARYHTGGHTVPSFTHQDMIDTFKRWTNL